MSKTVAIFGFIGILLLFPLLIIGLVILFIIGFCLSIALGIVVSPCALVK
jgi:hypothetical protein